MKGTVKWFNDQKGYGFLAGEDKKEYFAHFSAIQGSGFKTLAENEPVEFDVEQGDKGARAVNIRRLTAVKA